MSNALPLLFDALYWVFWTVTYTASGAVAFTVADALWGPSALERAFALTLGYLTFLHAFVLVLGMLKRLVQPKLRAGTSHVGKNTQFLAWGLNSIFQGIFTASFCANQIHLLFWLRYLHYRLMGMRFYPSTKSSAHGWNRSAKKLRTASFRSRGTFTITNATPRTEPCSS